MVALSQAADGTCSADVSVPVAPSTFLLTVGDTVHVQVRVRLERLAG